MHPSAMRHGRLFFDAYVKAPMRIVDIGAQNINGSLGELCPPGCDYVGVDFVAGNGVDVVLDDPYRLPFADASVDVVVTSSCLEHSEMFWLMFLEVLRVLKPEGLFYMNVPTNGAYHRYPVDCWRFYPDCGHALVKWARRNGYQPLLLESFVGHKEDGGKAPENDWADLIAVFLKDEAKLPEHPARILQAYRAYDNGYLHGSDATRNVRAYPEGSPFRSAESAQ